MRTAEIKRASGETDILVSLTLEGTGRYDVDTGCGFLDHMLELFARHGGLDLTIKCRGDVKTGYHHTVEDCGMVLGSALREALGDRSGINRYGSAVIPMDDALVLCAVDLSGRAYLGYGLQTPSARIGDFDTELAPEFLAALSRTLGANIHLRQFCGENSHHILEAAFKALARSLRQAVAMDPANAGVIPSTKGLLDI